MRTKIKIDDIYYLVKIVFYKHIRDILTEKIEEEVKKYKNEMEFLSVFTKKEDTPGFDIKPFKYQNLMDQCETYKLTNTIFDTKNHKIDEFLVDVYRSFCDMGELVHKAEELSSEYSGEEYGEDEEEMSEFMSFIKQGRKRVMQTYSKIKVIFDQIMLYHEFSEVEIRGIQYNYLKDMLTESIDNEDFEVSALIRDKIKSF